MSANDSLSSFKRIGTGLTFIVFPLVFVFAFAVHPGLLHPHFLAPTELIARARGASLLHFAHALVTLDTALLVVVAIHFMKVLQQGPGAWAGFVGALCLTMSSFEGLTDAEFASMMPGLLAMFSKRGWMVLLWGILFLPIGFAMQAVALLKYSSLPRWQSLLFLVAVLFIGMPDGVEVVNLTAALLLSVAFIPYGIGMIQANKSPGGGEP